METSKSLTVKFPITQDISDGMSWADVNLLSCHDINLLSWHDLTYLISWVQDFAATFTLAKSFSTKFINSKSFTVR